VFVEIVLQLNPTTDVVIVLADEDGDASRPACIAAAHAALDARHAKRRVLGVCNPTGEAWIVGLLAPSRSARAKRLDAALGRPVSTRPEKLTSRPNSAEHHAKRALRFLLDDGEKQPAEYTSSTLKSHEIEAALASAIGPQNAKRLAGCGVAAFWGELESVYAPMLR